MIIWVSTATTLAGTLLVLQGRKSGLTTVGALLDAREMPAALTGLGVLCLMVGSGLGLISTFSRLF